MINTRLNEITKRIEERSKRSRDNYEQMIADMQTVGVQRAHLSCGNLAHAYATMGNDKEIAIAERAKNIGIVTAYNDMLSAHHPYEHYPAIIKDEARKLGASAQVAGGVPAMCDGVTQGQVGMEMSLFSRDIIAQASAIALSHNVFDGALFLGVCDKIVPGLVIAAASFGHIPAVFVPAGPMTTGQSNEEKSEMRKKFTNGEIGREELLRSEMKSYHGAGTCTFYGTANTNQMLMEFMGLHLPGSSFVNPHLELRTELTKLAVKRILVAPRASEILNVKSYVNGMVGLMATGGSTNLLLHLIAMARASGIVLTWSDFSDLSELVPLIARVYPNGLADVNQFHAVGGLGFLINTLLEHGLLHGDNPTIFGEFSEYSKEPKLIDGNLQFVEGATETLNDKIIRPVSMPFQNTGGLKALSGNLGDCVIKVSAVDEKRHIIEAPARVFQEQEHVKLAFKANEFVDDVVIVVRYQGAAANGMPELHSLTPLLTILQERGLKVALVTDGRMSGASGKVPAAIHLSPEAAKGGPIARVNDGDIIKVDAVRGTIDVLNSNFMDREIAKVDLSKNQTGFGRELFQIYREHVGDASSGATQFFKE